MENIPLKLKIQELREKLDIPYNDQHLSLDEKIHKIRGEIQYQKDRLKNDNDK